MRWPGSPSSPSPCVVHALAIPRWVATTLALVVLAAQVAAVAWGWPGPGDGLGSLAMWGMRTHPRDLISAAAVVLLAGAALLIADRLRLEPLTRRADLVSQLRFAVTVQDLRTVVLLRRQLRGERPRSTPWIRLGRATGPVRPTMAVVQRGLRGLARYPASRLARMAATAVLAGLAVGRRAARHHAGDARCWCGLVPSRPRRDRAAVAGDRPSRRRRRSAAQRGWLLLRHLAAPIVALTPFALIGAVTVGVAQPSALAAALALALPVTLAGACGSVVSVVRDAADPLQAPSATVPPEFAGASSFIRLAVPIVISTIPALTALAMRERPAADTAVRMAVLDVLVIAATATWVRKGDEWRAKMRSFAEAGRRAS